MRARNRIAFGGLLVALAACGGGGSGAPAFAESVVGPAGGVVSAGFVRLTVPPAALTVDTVVGIVPEAPLPIDPGAVGVGYYTGCMCVGPTGQVLLVDGKLEAFYDVGLLPSGSVEGDLVLLEWDAANSWMRVRSGVGLTQDTTNHVFVDSTYAVLGHVAVGIRTGPSFKFVFLGGPVPTGLVAPRQLAGPAQLILADPDGGLLPTAVAGTDDAGDYLGSRDGTRVMYSLIDPQTESTSLDTFDVSPTGPFPSREILPLDSFTASDPLFGWLGDQDRVYHERSLVSTFGNVSSPSDAFAAVPGDGLGSVVNLESRSGNVSIDDVRVSPDRSMVLVKWLEFGQVFTTHLDVIQASDGTPIRLDLPTSVRGAQTAPRWLPDSSGLYFVEDDDVTVTRIDPDGSNAAMLYTLPSNVSDFSTIVDFVVAPPFAPAAQRCAYVRRESSKGTFDVFETDRLSGGDVHSDVLGDTYQVVEMAPLFSDSFQTSLVMVQLRQQLRIVDGAGGPSFPSPPDDKTLLFDLGDASLRNVIPVPITSIDLGNVPGHQGQMLVWIQQFDDSYPEFPNPGIWLLDSFSFNAVDVTPLGFEATGPARWLRSWRFAPGFDSGVPRLR